MKKKKGFFVTFEGPEGSGKSTQIKRLESYLKRKGHKTLLLREPGGTHVSEAIRHILLDTKSKGMSPEVELLLYLAARGQIVREKILPALKKGKVVICDRFEDSTVAYQGYGRGLSLDFIQSASHWVRGKLVPDLTILLDLSPEDGFKRTGRRDRMEQESINFHRRVRKGFLALARKNSKRFVVLDATKKVDFLSNRIQGIVNDRLR